MTWSWNSKRRRLTSVMSIHRFFTTVNTYEVHPSWVPILPWLLVTSGLGLVGESASHTYLTCAHMVVACLCNRACVSSRLCICILAHWVINVMKQFTQANFNPSVQPQACRSGHVFFSKDKCFFLSRLCKRGEAGGETMYLILSCVILTLL